MKIAHLIVSPDWLVDLPARCARKMKMRIRNENEKTVTRSLSGTVTILFGSNDRGEMLSKGTATRCVSRPFLIPPCRVVNRCCCSCCCSRLQIAFFELRRVSHRRDLPGRYCAPFSARTFPPPHDGPSCSFEFEP